MECSFAIDRNFKKNFINLDKEYTKNYYNSKWIFTRKDWKWKLAVGLFSLPAVADFDIDGQITQINDAKKTITIAGPSGNVEIQVFPYTELKGDDCGMFGAWDTHEKFSALKVGMFVSVDAIPQAQGMLGAKEIEWQCGRKAY